ncbi:hypothetical protein AB2M62_19185 [Sphingomonas sp. MMS12-HWE2-04]|uniref:WapI family immunity protein n=1 Tax=Sphingomonas sp. MMS12-HWE2-04 TaxID=3234199 RepID=UPI00384BABF8
MSQRIQAVFEGPAGALRLGIKGYQFPHNVEDEWDSNWLIVTGEAVLDGQRWNFCDPSLTTFELARLADWLDRLAAGAEQSAACQFTEPNLDFRRVSDHSLRVAFSLEAQPRWAELKDDFGAHGFEVPIDSGIATAAQALRALLALFPVRARAPRT